MPLETFRAAVRESLEIASNDDAFHARELVGSPRADDATPAPR